MTDDRIAELLGWPRSRANRDSSLMHRIRIVVAEAQAEQDAEIERLRAELAEAKRDADRHRWLGHDLPSLDRLDAAIERVLAEVDRLRTENERLREDAERYRWLRGDSCADHSVRWTQWEVRCWRAPIWSHDLRRTNLDEEIDAALCKENTDAR